MAVKVVIEPLWDVAKCEFWIGGGGAAHDQACQVAGGVVSGGGLEDGVGAVGGSAERDLGGAGEGVLDGNAAAASDSVNEALADEADIVAAKRANAQGHAKEADAEAAKASEPETGNSSTKPTVEPKTSSRCSFSPDTPVLMDKGKTKPIGKIKTGDKVEAANSKTGKHQGARTVQHVWINHDRDLLDLTLRTESGRTATLHTTANHPFWDDTTHTWVAAGKLHDGDALNTATNGHAYVVKTQPTPGTANRWNLTVQQLHTYYVVAGGVSILVHNSNGPDSCPVLGAARAAADTASTITPGKARPAVAEALQLPEGQIYSSPSIRGVAPELHPDVQAILDDIPEGERGVGHGRCGLAVCVSDALSDGFNPTGSRAAAVIVRSSTDNPMHGMPVGPCDSCVALEDAFDITFEGIG